MTFMFLFPEPHFDLKGIACSIENEIAQSTLHSTTVILEYHWQ